MALKLYTLYSGSGGNAFFFRMDSLRLLIDAGGSCARLTRALTQIGESTLPDAILLTHEHTDHTAALAVLCKRTSIPVYLHPASLQTPLFSPDSRAVLLRSCLVPFPCTETAGQASPSFAPLTFTAKNKQGSCTVTLFSLPHDSASCTGFRIDTAQGSIGYATDVGRPTPALLSHLRGCTYVVLESNHDLTMLAQGPYPPPLKARILSDGGHLSNEACAQCCVELAKTGTKRILLAHLSEENNTPLTAFRCVFSALSQAGLEGACTVAVARATEPTCLLDQFKKEKQNCACH